MHRRLERLLRLRAAARSRPGCREPDGGYARFDFGRLNGFEIRDRDGALPEVVAHYHGTYCGDDSRIGADPAPAPGASPATRPSEPPVDPRGGRRRAGPGRAAGGGAGRLDAAPGPGREPGGARRRHRRHRLARRLLPAGPAVPRGDLPRAPGGRRGDARLRLQPGRARGPRRLRGDRRRRLRRARSPTARSPQRLAGRDSEVAVSVDGAAQGVLSLAGSTKALRGALQDCRSGG